MRKLKWLSCLMTIVMLMTMIISPTIAEDYSENIPEIVSEAVDEISPEIEYELSDDGTSNEPIFAAQALTTFELMKNVSRTVNLGEAFQITLGDKVAQAYNTSASKVATVSETGLVTPVKVGKAKITVTLTDKKKLTLTLTVVDPTMPTGITLDQSGTITLDKNETLQLHYALAPSTAESDILWKTSAAKTARVDANGLVTPLKNGSVTISAQTTRGKKTAKVKIKITDLHAPTKIVIDQGKSITANVGDNLQLSATISSEVAPAMTNVAWTSSKAKVATVDQSGNVKLLSTGKARITATTSNKKKATITITVKKSSVTPTNTVTPTPSIVPSPTVTVTPSPIPVDEVEPINMTVVAKQSVYPEGWEFTKNDLVVTVHYSDGTTKVISEYEISGQEVENGDHYLVIVYEEDLDWFADVEVPIEGGSVSPDPEKDGITIVSISSDKALMEIGETATWNVVATGGNGKLSYNYELLLNDEIIDTSISDNATYTHTIAKEGTYALRVIVSDKDSHTVEGKSGALIVLNNTTPTSADSFKYKVLSEQYAAITGYVGKEEIVRIPESIDGYTIQSISNNAFKNNKAIKYVFLPDTVIEIGSSAFSGCASLNGIDIGNGITTIGANAFDSCTDLQSISFPDGLKTIGKSSFSGCSSLNSISFGNGLESIGLYCFQNCENLKEAMLPDSVTAIGSYAFASCKSLTAFHFPINWSKVAPIWGGYNPELEGHIFDSDTLLKKIEVPEGATQIPASAFQGAMFINSISLASTIKTIGMFAFSSCEGLTDMKFPSQLEYVGRNAFENCKHLREAILPDAVDTIGTRAFSNCESLTKFHYPSSWSKVATKWGGYNPELEGYTFEGCVNLKSIDIPEGAKQIPTSAFQGCTYIENVTFPSTIETVGMYAFSDCENLKEAILPDSVTAIGTRAFINCVSLTKFHYPISWSKVIPKWGGYNPELEGHIFEGCVKLKSIDIPEGAKQIPTSAFQASAYIENVSFPSTIETVGMYAFSDCESLKEAILPDGVTAIGTKAFINCSSLTKFHYPSNWSKVIPKWGGYNPELEGHIFEGCVSLKSIEIPTGVKVIPASAFQASDSIESFVVPDSVTTVEKYAFSECSILKKLYLGTNVSSIGNKAFNSCPALTIWTEYGSYALQYCKDNNIPYYYLTPDGVNAPSGTLYKGDSYALYGHARSSIAITEITATIWDSNNKAVQTITVNPGTTDYNLAGTVNANLLFGNLGLGNYRYTLKAKTSLSEETWIDSGFSIIPPPLRVFKSGVSIPFGLYGAEDNIPVAGIISANYPIAKISLGAFTATGAQTTQVYNGAPMTTSFDLSTANLKLNGLTTGSYIFKVVVTGNGETVTVIASEFTISGATAINLNSIDRSALSAYIANKANESPFDNIGYFDTLQRYMTDEEKIKYALNTYDDKVTSAIIDIFQGGLGITDVRRNEYLVTLYKEEIQKYIKEHAVQIADFEYEKPDHEKTVKNIISLHKIHWEQIKEDLGSAATSYEKDYIDSVNDFLKDVDWSITSTEQIIDLSNIVIDAFQDYTQGIQVLDTLMSSELDPSYSNYNYQLAVREVKDEYTSDCLRLYHKLFKYAKDACAKEAKKQIVKYAIEAVAGGEFYVAYKITKATWDIYTNVTGFYDDVSSLDEYDAQVNTFYAAYDNYTECFNKLRNGNGNFDDNTIKRMIQNFELAKSAGIRSLNTLKTIDIHTRFISNSEIDKAIAKMQAKTCP